MVFQSVKNYCGLSYPGVEVEEHPTRLYRKKPDLNFRIRFKINKEPYQVTLGYSSEGWTFAKASAEIETYKKGNKPIEPKKSSKIDINDNAEKTIDEMTITEIFEEKFTPLHLNSLKYNTRKARNSTFNRSIKPTLGHLKLSEITKEEILNIKKIQEESKKQRATINTFLITLQSIYTFSIRVLGYRGINPVGKDGISVPKAKNKRTRWFTIEEARLILDTLEKKSLKVFQLASISFQSGMRHSEVISLKWQDVDLNRRIAIARNPKNGNPRNIFITDEMFKIMKEMKTDSSKPSDFLFPRNNGGNLTPAPPKIFKTTLDELKMNEGITDRLEIASWHTIRHSWASWLVQNGCPLEDLMELGGWSNYEMVLRYAHLKPQKLEMINDIFKKIDLKNEGNQ